MYEKKPVERTITTCTVPQPPAALLYFPACSFPQREVTNKQTKQTKPNRTKMNRQFISQNQHSGKTQGCILSELTGWSSLRTIFLGGFSLLVSDPAPIKVNGDVAINNP